MCFAIYVPFIPYVHAVNTVDAVDAVNSDLGYIYCKTHFILVVGVPPIPQPPNSTYITVHITYCVQNVLLYVDIAATSITLQYVRMYVLCSHNKGLVITSFLAIIGNV